MAASARGGAGLVMLVIARGVGWTAWALSDDASALIESLPNAAHKMRAAIHTHHRCVDDLKAVGELLGT